MAITDRAAPYAQRLIDDRELQRDLRDLAAAIRGGYGRAEKRKKKPSRLADDKKFKRSAQRAAASFKDAQARFRGEEPKSHRGRKLLIGLLLIAGVAFAAKKLLGEDDSYTAQTPVSSQTPAS